MESSEFRRILGHWVSGVAVVATRTANGKLCGLTANAIASVSLEPPLILVCVERSAGAQEREQHEPRAAHTDGAWRRRRPAMGRGRGLQRFVHITITPHRPSYWGGTGPPAAYASIAPTLLGWIRLIS